MRSQILLTAAAAVSSFTLAPAARAEEIGQTGSTCVTRARAIFPGSACRKVSTTGTLAIPATGPSSTT
jgi:hypothetical protein